MKARAPRNIFNRRDPVKGVPVLNQIKTHPEQLGNVFVL
jgi:hypothetical protein